MCHLNAYDDYRNRFLAGDFTLMADLTGSILNIEENQIVIKYLKKECIIDLTTGEISSKNFIPNNTDKIIIWNYMSNAQACQPNNKWVGFLEFPDAQNHQMMFKGSVLDPISRTFGSNGQGFTDAALLLGGETVKMGDLGYIIRVFPKILLAVSLYMADDEFPASVNMVFDAAVVGQLNSPNVYTLGGEIARKLCGINLGR